MRAHLEIQAEIQAEIRIEAGPDKRRCTRGARRV